MTVIIGSSGVFSKTSPGTSDVTQANRTLGFMGSSLVGINSVLGFNGSASSVSVQLVEDTVNGDVFTQPDVPSIHAISLPSGGISANPLSSGANLNPDAFNPNKFYFAGVCTSWTEQEVSARGRTINVTLADPRELMGGIICLLNGFALSQTIGTATIRHDGVDNIIDIFGYYNYGMESDANEFGLEWSKIKTAIEAIRVTVNDINLEFTFTGDTFTNVPSYYRISGETMDLLSLISKVATDGGSDFVTIGRKVSSDTLLVEIKGIRRTEDDTAKKSEILNFVNARSGIVEYYEQGREYRPEPTSSIVVGGPKNANYVALPTNFVEGFHLDTNDDEDYSLFPTSITERLITGTDVNAGAIFPFWGFAPSGTDYPMLEPYISFDHVAFDYEVGYKLNVAQAIPQISIGYQEYTIRQINHDDMFINGDGDSDSRPFGYVIGENYSTADQNGYFRGLPLNTEVLKFALVGHEEIFWTLYSLYYPQAANNLNLPRIEFSEIPEGANLADINIMNFFKQWGSTFYRAGLDALGIMFGKDSSQYKALQAGNKNNILGLEELKSFMFKAVRKYAEEHLGRKFMVALPKSFIMERIWDGLNVPTPVDRPEIEYRIDSHGFWENTPSELDGFQDPSGLQVFSVRQEQSIRRRFMAEDGRFQAMVAMPTYPSGNASFLSNGKNYNLFQDLNESDFRPNIIQGEDPDFPPYVFIAPSKVGQISERRPDMALVTLANPVQINPTDNVSVNGENFANEEDDPTLITLKGIRDFFTRLYVLDTDFQTLIANSNPGPQSDVTFFQTVSMSWASQIYDNYKNDFRSNLEFCMDPKGIVIPLTSNWVTYGPWFSDNTEAKGKLDIVVDKSLVPWNFNPNGDPYVAISNMNAAGVERQQRTVSVLEYLDRAKVTTAGFPEFSLAHDFGFNSNLTNVNVSFSNAGIKTTYNFSSFSARPGTFRKSDFDQLDRVRRDTKPPIVTTDNISLQTPFRGSAGRDFGESYNTDRFF